MPKIVTEKRCTKCGKVKPISDFRLQTGNAHKNKGYYRSWCRRCDYDSTHERAKIKKDKFYKLRSNLSREGGQISLDDVRSLGYPDVCYLCGQPISDWFDAEMDHILPLSAGGKTRKSNLAWTHKTCNRMKHDLTVPVFLERIRKILSNW